MNLPNEKKKLKERLIVEQLEGLYSIYLQLSKPDHEIRQLLFIPREEGYDRYVMDIHSEQEDGKLKFTFDIAAHPELIEVENVTYDLSFVVRAPRSSVSKKKLEKNPEKYSFGEDAEGNETVEYPIRLGKFEETYINSLDPVEVAGKQCLLFVTIKGNLSFMVNGEAKPYGKTEIIGVDFAEGIMKLQMKIMTKNSLVKNSRILFKSRKNASEYAAPVSCALLEEETVRNFGLNHYMIDNQINLNEMLQPYVREDDVLDVFVEMAYHDFEEPLTVRVGKPSDEAEQHLNSTALSGSKYTYIVSPYYTIGYQNLSLELEQFTAKSYRYLEKTMKRLNLLRPFYARKDIWIVGERPYKAQDTGYHFFKYMREHHPEKNVYYVIEKDSPELKNVEKYGNILIYKSEDHILYTLMATRIIGSHHPEYLYPLRTDEFKEKVQAQKVFLQHGVLGVKNIEEFYSAKSGTFKTDLFIVSSDFEKQIVTDDLHYKPGNIAVTGLSRFDSLFAEDVPEKRQLLIIPTWREWLSNAEQFEESEYFARYKNLINNTELHEMAEKYGFDIVFCLHPNMQNFTKYFEDAPVRVITQGEVEVQNLLKESAMMITDYSSVAFDFSFLEKPVIYYQFDRERYIGKKGSHLDMEQVLPGEIVQEEDAVTKLVDTYAARNFEMQEEYKERASKFLKYKDMKASERICEAIEKMGEKAW
ncbi:CDP-glycerol glycerophosphotransferase family protein [Aciduricibacillus chroicocephali]|uniref:CDP-glycerol glycerophosphotransferase family protein n=1 Tax=Aciduricibacillus chroicocephali TaxID=3054939 RepID=A0ABY9KTU3_9BACI|nr:CDP-glycerol glycerophosphotransferase family protein [Bacillaceae bacterium 44XB]